MRVAVVQLCRLGDLVQTLPMLQGLKRDGHLVELIVRPESASLPIAPGVVDAIHVLPTALDEDEAMSRWLERVGELAELCRRLRERRFDLLINLSHDRQSGWLALYMEPKKVLGVSEGRDRKSAARDPWTQYLLGVPSNRHVGAFNLADVYGNLASTVLEQRAQWIRPSDRDVVSARRLLGHSESRKVGLVPGASDGRKRWSAASYARVATALSSDGYQVALLGAPSERSLGEEIRRRTDAPLLDLIGETSIPVLSAVLGQLDLLVTNDTGTMHLAAAVGTTTLSVSVGPSAVFDSAPFGAGHVTIVPELHCYPCDYASFCADPICHDVVEPDTVVALAHGLLEGHGSPANTSTAIRVYGTRFHPSGVLSVDPLERYPLRAEDAMRAVYRRMWTRTLGASGVSDRAMASDDERPETLAGELARQWDVSSAGEVLERLDAAAVRLEGLASQANAACAELLKTLEMGAADSVARVIDPFSQSMALTGRLEPLLRPLTQLAAMQLQLAGSRDERQVVTDLLQALSSTSNRATLVERLVVTTLSELRGLDREPRTA